MNPLRLALSAAAVTLAASTALAAPVSATPSRDTNGVILWQVTDGGTDYVFREITIAPGGSTGWHAHPGQLLATVKEGVLLHNRADCSVDGVYVAGQDITEKGGPGYVHIGRNVGPTPLVLQVLYINPAGAPLADDAPDPGCGFA
ncbi:cupin domain-containing protein [Mycolicibacterium litorale]|uniref:cupin domain-containing protein n=1 Tax=Mycolicibacterium litorale TaxID=758802 RepID=UPI0010646C81|nr:cupin domain-containing protein [Mycolicibacterium litorale]MCV7418247.1 cupin [Mycolicibacterium litorale]